MGETRGEKDERKAIKLLDSSVQRGRIVQKKRLTKRTNNNKLINKAALS